MGPFDVVVPDLLVVLRDQSDILTARNIQGAPALVIELVRNTVTIHSRAEDGSFPMAATLDSSPGATLEPPLLQGWSLELAHVFR
jgi:Uma2 family endonuclease